ncbi:MAG: hypothetical protein WCH76_03975 [Candidatus Riflemargulisbacteria bacterium]
MIINLDKNALNPIFETVIYRNVVLTVIPKIQTPKYEKYLTKTFPFVLKLKNRFRKKLLLKPKKELTIFAITSPTIKKLYKSANEKKSRAAPVKPIIK